MAEDDSTPTNWVTLGWSRWTVTFRNWAEDHDIFPRNIENLTLHITGSGNKTYTTLSWGKSDEGRRYHNLPSPLWMQATLDYLMSVDVYRQTHTPGHRLRVGFFDTMGNSSFACWWDNYTFPDPSTSEEEEVVVEEPKPEETLTATTSDSNDAPTLMDHLLGQD